MYLSRLRLNPTLRGTRRLVGSPQAMHAVIAGSHPPHDADGRVLWRLDQPASHDLQLYVLSPVVPDFRGLIEQAGWTSAPDWETTDYNPFLSRLAMGQQWRFRLTANPTRSVSTGNSEKGARGRVSPHVTVAQQQEWLERRSSTWGFEIRENSLEAKQLDVSERGTARFSRSVPDEQGAGRNRVAISRATFTGVLQVNDADALRTALTHGMGRAKAYGCGLMSLARIGA